MYLDGYPMPSQIKWEKDVNVSVFVSTYENKIDSKGRVSVPAPFRNTLARTDSGLFIFESLELPCLEASGSDYINTIISAMSRMDALSEDVHILETLLTSTKEMKIDSDGRIMLPEDFIELADLSSPVIFAGVGRKFRIWNKQRFEEHNQKSREKARSGMRLPELILSEMASKSNSGGG